MRETFIQKLASHIIGHYDLTNQEVTVVFPNKRAAYYLRNEFKKSSQQTILAAANHFHRGCRHAMERHHQSRRHRFVV